VRTSEKGHHRALGMKSGILIGTRREMAGPMMRLQYSNLLWGFEREMNASRVTKKDEEEEEEEKRSLIAPSSSLCL
jgi:hypothetical protein